MTNSLIEVQGPLEYIEPKYNSTFLTITKMLLPWWLKLKTNIREVEANNLDVLIDLYQQFQNNKIRLLLAFRHPRTEDPLCMAQLLWRILPQEAKKRNIKLHSPTHTHFVYDRGIPLWAGDWIAGLFSRLGGSSIQRGKLDLLGLKGARNLFVNGKFPLAIAPEGATNGHNEVISALEPGIAQLSFWCVEDLQKADRDEEVIILPVGIKYSYLDKPWEEIAQMLTRLEQDCGLENSSSQEKISDYTISNQEINHLYARLMKIGDFLLSEIESFYDRFYHQPLSEINLEENTNKILALRLKRLLDNILKVAENYFHIKPKGEISDRCRRLEQAAWDYIYQQDFKEENISPIKRGLANHVAKEAQLHIWHMRIVEKFVAVTGSYIKENPTVERFAETLIILEDLFKKIKGENIATTAQFGQQKVNLIMGKPISVNSLYPNYQKSRRRAIADLTKDLEFSLYETLETNNPISR